MAGKKTCNGRRQDSKGTTKSNPLVEPNPTPVKAAQGVTAEIPFAVEHYKEAERTVVKDQVSGDDEDVSAVSSEPDTAEAQHLDAEVRHDDVIDYEGSGDTQERSFLGANAEGYFIDDILAALERESKSGIKRQTEDDIERSLDGSVVEGDEESDLEEPSEEDKGILELCKVALKILRNVIKERGVVIEPLDSEKEGDVGLALPQLLEEVIEGSSPTDIIIEYSNALITKCVNDMRMALQESERYHNQRVAKIEEHHDRRVHDACKRIERAYEADEVWRQQFQEERNKEISQYTTLITRLEGLATQYEKLYQPQKLEESQQRNERNTRIYHDIVVGVVCGAAAYYYAACGFYGVLGIAAMVGFTSFVAPILAASAAVPVFAVAVGLAAGYVADCIQR